ncbi:MAG: hypothetical protein JW902_19165 [Syntrophaceae bacterium]|nr:hypothetical protein [Syntrophaceae bacterium]
MKRQGRGRKKRFIGRFQRGFLLRFHMSLILAAACLSGTLFSKLLLLLPVRDPVKGAYHLPLTLPQAPAGDFPFHRFIETICDDLDALLVDREMQETDFVVDRISAPLERFPSPFTSTEEKTF